MVDEPGTGGHEQGNGIGAEVLEWWRRGSALGDFM
jgi:hypothetical protein